MWCRSLAVCLFLVTLGCGSGSQEDGDSDKRFRIRFGIMAGTMEQPVGVTEETRKILRRPRTEGFVFGLEILPWDTGYHDYYLIHHLPVPPRALSGAERSGPEGVAASGIRSRDYRHKGRMIWPLGFDEGDPLGTYKLDLFIDGTLYRTIEYSVVEPGSR